jgi:hypothetical protein
VVRAIVRYSFDGGAKGARTKVRKALRAAGFQEVGTASFELRDAPCADIVEALHEVLDIVKDPPAGVRIDHLWIYLDEPHERRHTED